MSKLDTNECARLADEAINQCVTAGEVRALVKERLGEIN